MRAYNECESDVQQYMKDVHKLELWSYELGYKYKIDSRDIRYQSQHRPSHKLAPAARAKRATRHKKRSLRPEAKAQTP